MDGRDPVVPAGSGRRAERRHQAQCEADVQADNQAKQIQCKEWAELMTPVHPGRNSE